MSLELDTYNATGLIWLCWHIVGLHPFPRLKWLYYTYSLVINLLFSILSPMFIVMSVFSYDNIALIIHSLQASPTLVIATLKSTIFFLNISRLQSLRPYLCKLDERALRNQEDLLYLRKVIKQCRHITIAIWILFSMSLMSFAVPAFFKKQLLLEAWYPFDWRAHFAAIYAYQFFAIAFQVVQNCGCDSSPPVYLHLLRGHIQVLCMKVSRIGKDPEMSEEDTYQELKSCILDHKNIICIFDIVKPVISQTAFLQIVITGFVWCLAMVHYFLFNREFSQLLSTMVYMTAVISQLFPVCYTGNELTTVSASLTEAIYNCNWMDQPMKFRKTLIIFMQRSQKVNIIQAGGLLTISLQLLLAVVRFSFSVFTVMSQME